MKQSIVDAYLSGFEAAVGGSITEPEQGSPYAAGFAQGKRAATVAEHKANRHADRVLASPAMKQARENAQVKP